ncbi:MAG: hypothetical protein HQL75_11170 [Magnetococcales bacterium]|nr:hypothetical protein [Magnetococcales bacterium]
MAAIAIIQNRTKQGQSSVFQRKEVAGQSSNVPLDNHREATQTKPFLTHPRHRQKMRKQCLENQPDTQRHDNRKYQMFNVFPHNPRSDQESRVLRSSLYSFFKKQKLKLFI